MSEEIKTTEDPRRNSEISPGKKFIFENKEILLLIIIFLAGTIFRYYAAVGVEPNADEMVHGPHATGIISSGVIGRVWQSILWSYLTDFFQYFLGITLFSARFLSFIFGSLTILIVYLIGLEIFDKRSALIAAFLISISSFHVIYTLIEMDIAAIFFVLLGALFFIKGIKKDSGFSLWSAFFIGVAALIKTLALFFVPAFLIFFFINKKSFDKKSLISALKFIGVILLIFSPILVHNTLWYRESGMVDAYLAQYFDIGKAKAFYEQAQGAHPGFKFQEIFSGSWDMLDYYFRIDPTNIILGILGIGFFLHKKTKFAIFFLLFQVIPFLLITITNRLQTHYAIFPPVFALYGGALIYSFSKKYDGKISYKKIVSVVLIIVAIINVAIMLPYLTQKSGVGEMRNYVSEEIENKDIVIADARIYRGRIMWMFMDSHYLESSYLENLLTVNSQLPGDEIPFNVYFVECVVDDCGWGTIANQPEFNQSVEEIVTVFRESSIEQKTIYGRNTEFPREKNTPYFKVYKTSINLKPSILQAIDETHSFFFYPERYEPREKVVDNYKIDGFIDWVLFYFAKAIIWITLIVSLASVFLVFYLVFSEVRNEKNRIV